MALTSTPLPSFTAGVIPNATQLNAVTTAVNEGVIQPPRARLKQTIAQSIPAGAPTAVTFDTVTFNVGGLFTAGSPTKLTAPYDGCWDIRAQLPFAIGGGVQRYVGIRVNGTTFIDITDFYPGTTHIASGMIASLYELALGDYVEVIAYTDSATTLQTTAGFAPSFSVSWHAPHS